MKLLKHRNTPPASGSLIPFSSRDFWSISPDIDQWMGSLFDSFSRAQKGGGFFPVDMYEDDTNTYIRADMPGVTRGDINVEIVNGNLNITASRKTGTPGKDEQLYSFKRSVTVPENIDAGKISAAYENGVLTVTLPKKEEAQPKKFTVTVK